MRQRYYKYAAPNGAESTAAKHAEARRDDRKIRAAISAVPAGLRNKSGAGREMVFLAEYKDGRVQIVPGRTDEAEN